MDIIAPTKERLAKHSDWETPQSDQKTRRSHYRTMNPVEGMHRRGWIRDEQWQAFQKWSADLTKATRVHVAMVKYGRPFVTVDEHSLDPADAAACAVGRVRAAASDVGHANTIRALTVAALRESSLETIGREICGEGNKTAAIAAAKHVMQIGTHRLALHYQFIRGP